MRLDDITIALRPRTPWEASDLGIALARRHAKPIWGAWLAVTLPVFIVVNALAWWIDRLWLATLVMWWLKPVFDRIPLYVLSRAVFGEQPTIAATIRAQRDWGLKPMLAWLTWRRLHISRSLLLPVDLLEGVTGTRRRDRARVLSGSQGGTAGMLTVIGLHLEGVVWVGIILFALMFVPIEFLSESAQATWETLIEAPPAWAEFVANLLGWIATTVIEPFYVAAGFGLYLNRRTHLEAWDIELAFRRIAQRLAQPLAAIALACALLVATTPPAHAAKSSPDGVAGAAAQGATPGKRGRDPTLQGMFGRRWQDDGDAFAKAVDAAYANGDLAPKETRDVWERRDRDRNGNDGKAPGWADALATVVAVIAKSAVWVLVALLAYFIVRTRDRWLPWFSDRFVATREPDAIALHDVAAPDALPDDVAAAARALWSRGDKRAALALLYRGAVQRLVDALGRPLPPGATEADCLAQARALDDATASAWFARIVRAWQAAAYADRTPDDDAFASLVRDFDAPLPQAAP